MKKEIKKSNKTKERGNWDNEVKEALKLTDNNKKKVKDKIKKYGKLKEKEESGGCFVVEWMKAAAEEEEVEEEKEYL